MIESLSGHSQERFTLCLKTVPFALRYDAHLNPYIDEHLTNILIPMLKNIMKLVVDILLYI